MMISEIRGHIIVGSAKTDESSDAPRPKNSANSKDLVRFKSITRMRGALSDMS
jgi:hypothetical protein